MELSTVISSYFNLQTCLLYTNRLTIKSVLLRSFALFQEKSLQICQSKLPREIWKTKRTIQSFNVGFCWDTVCCVMTFMDILYFVFYSIVHNTLLIPIQPSGQVLICPAWVYYGGDKAQIHPPPPPHRCAGPRHNADANVTCLLGQTGWLASLTGCHRTKGRVQAPLPLHAYWCPVGGAGGMHVAPPCEWLCEVPKL